MLLGAIKYRKACFHLRPDNSGVARFGCDLGYGLAIDCASKSILLTTPEGRRIKYVSRHEPKRTQVNTLSGVV